MHVKSVRDARGRARGLSLIEAVVASSVLLATCLAAGAALSAARGVERQAEERAALGAVLASERAWLSSLPYYIGPPVEVDAAGGSSLDSALRAVFPHAVPGLNEASAFYSGDSSAVAVFTTAARRDRVHVRREARFVRRTGLGWEALRASEVEGWILGEADLPPSSILQVTITATMKDRSSSLTLTLQALPVELGAVCTASAGGGRRG